MNTPSRDFFISYTQTDRAWAEWIGWILEEAGYTIVLQAWDFPPASNFVVEMQKAAAGAGRTLAVISPAYLESLYCMAEWAAAFAADPVGADGKLVPVRVVAVERPGLLGQVVSVDLFGCTEAAARERLLSALVAGRRKPVVKPGFPGSRAPFPGAPLPADKGESGAETLAQLPVDEIPEPSPLPPGSRMPLASNPSFVGREDELRELARLFKVGGAAAVTATGSVAAATGLGGLGKTQLAAEFAHRYGRFFEGGVFWLTFANAGTVPAEVVDCGRSLQLGVEFDTLPQDQQIRLVIDAWQSAIPRLLVFDNCEEPALLTRWRPKTGGCRVLVTSRRSEWPRGTGVREIHLKTLPPAQSVEMLLRYRPDLEHDTTVLAEIASELGHLPLALHLAGSYLERYQYDPPGQPAAYLEALRSQGALGHRSLAGFGAESNPTEHDLHVGRSFGVSHAALDPANPADAMALQLLARAACLAEGEPIPRDLLLLTLELPADEEARMYAIDGIGRAISLGLFAKEDHGALVLHRLLAAFIRGLEGQDEAGPAVERALSREAGRINRAGYPARLLAWQLHLRVVTARAAMREDRIAAMLCNRLGYHLNTVGALDEARQHYERALAIHQEVLGEENPDTALSLNNLGAVLDNQGDYAGARQYYERALAIRMKVLGEEHPHTAGSLNNLGYLMQIQGDYAGARQHYERALAIRKKVLGEEHPDTAQSLNNLGALMRTQGDSAGARQYYERALAIRKKVLGEEHPDTAQSLNNLGALLNSQGDSAGARQHYERALAIFENQLGPDHPLTLTVRRNLASLEAEAAGGGGSE